jgi:hypothetical protein
VTAALPTAATVAARVEPEHAVPAMAEVLGELVITPAMLAVTMHYHHERGALRARGLGQPVTVIKAQGAALQVTFCAMRPARPRVCPGYEGRSFGARLVPQRHALVIFRRGSLRIQNLVA